TPRPRRPFARRRIRAASSLYVSERSPAMSAMWSWPERARRSIQAPTPAFPRAELPPAAITSALQAPEELVLVDDLDAQLEGAGLLRTRALAHHDERGLLRHAGRDLRAHCLRGLLGVSSTHGLEAPRDHDRRTGQRALRRGLHRLVADAHPGRAQSFDER